MTCTQRFLDTNDESLHAYLPFSEFQKQPLVSLDDATKTLQQVIPNFAKQLKKARERTFDPIEGLNSDEAAAIYLYTLEQPYTNESVCVQLNDILHSKLQGESHPWLSYLKLFVTALSKLPPFKGTIYRGIRSSVGDRYQSEVVWHDFRSCTENVNVIEDILGPTGKRTILEIVCMNGRSIRNYSSFEDQNEVLLMPGTCLRWINSREPEQGLTIVRFEEIQSKHQLLAPPTDPILSMEEAVVMDTTSATYEEETEEFTSSKLPASYNQANKTSSASSGQAEVTNIPRFPSPYNRVLPHKIRIGTPPNTSASVEILMSLIGSLVGLAVGDALGASVEFRSHAYLVKHPVTRMQSGGTWNLEAGQWTDDTSMALCLASSLITKRGFDPYDQLVRYKWWFKHGFLSSTGHCFDIGSATRRALDEFMRRQKNLKRHFNCRTNQDVDQLDYDLVAKVPGFSVNCSSPNIAGNGALMRLAPVPLFYFRSPPDAIKYAGLSAVITHGDPKAVDACRYYAALIVAALRKESKDDLLNNTFYEQHMNWFSPPVLHTDILRIAHGSYKKRAGYEGGIRGKGYVVNALEAALWAFWSDQNSFETGVLAAIQLGDDTDTTAAIYGQLAGAFYGYDKIPDVWRQKVYAHDFLDSIGRWLYFLGEGSRNSE